MCVLRWPLQLTVFMVRSRRRSAGTGTPVLSAAIGCRSVQGAKYVLSTPEKVANSLGEIGLFDAYKIRLSQKTGAIFDAIIPTQPGYPGSVIPKSFEMTLPNGKRAWVAGNATEHIVEFAQMKAVNYTPEAVRLASQEQLSSLQAAVNTATKNGIPYNQMISVDGWDLKFAPPRQLGQLPSLIHALPN